MSPAKVMLSPKEQELVLNTDWILTKNAVIQKVYELFGLLSASYQTMMETCPLPNREEVLLRSPKISKGEQYEGLPWVMLDYPRHYLASDSFGIRTFFWWGNSFSITLQLAGTFQQEYLGNIQQYFQKTDNKSDWLIGVGEDPWQHHFREDNYQPVSSLHEKQFAEHHFLKLTRQFPLTNWENMEQVLEESFREILCMLFVNGK